MYKHTEAKTNDRGYSMGATSQKFGWKALFRNPFRAIIAFLVAVVSFAAAGFSIFTHTYQFEDFDRNRYFSSENSFTNIIIMQEGRGSNQPIDYQDYGVLMEKLEEIGCGYALCHEGRGASPYPGMAFGPYFLNFYLGLGGDIGEWDASTFTYLGSRFGELNGERLIAPYVDPLWDGYGNGYVHSSQIFRDFFGRRPFSVARKRSKNLAIA